VTAAGGFLIHPLPGCEPGVIDDLEDRMRTIRPVTAMIRDGMSPRKMMEEAVGRPVDVREDKEVVFFCPCTRERARDALVALGPAEMDRMAGEGKDATVRCAFCRSAYVVPHEELCFLAKEADAAP